MALVSGAARGQGRSHAVRLAEEGADLIAFDVCRQLGTVEYPMATSEDLKETAQLVEDLDRHVVAREAEVRDLAGVQAAVDEGVREFGRLDIVCANAGIGGFAGNLWSLSEERWEEMIAVNLSGVWKTVRAAVPAMIDAGNGGSIVLTMQNALPVRMVEAVDVSNAIVWLASDEARYVTGVMLPIDAGFLNK